MVINLSIALLFILFKNYINLKGTFNKKISSYFLKILEKKYR